MARRLRLEFAGALYHVTARGNERRSIFLGDADGDCAAFLDVLGATCERFNWLVHAYCLMTNHYHLLVETPDANLYKGMRQLNGVFTQSVNRAHARVGHLFQGRFKAILVARDSYLLELSRYVVLNPVRAGMVAAPGDWPWSSYRAMVGEVPAPGWLETDAVLRLFAEERTTAVTAYRRFVAEGIGAASPWQALKGLPGLRAIRRTHAGAGRPRTPLARDPETPAPGLGPASGRLCCALRRPRPRDGRGVPLGRLQYAGHRRVLRRQPHDRQSGGEASRRCCRGA
jgi:REP element-mobilizing transposase RayT